MQILPNPNQENILSEIKKVDKNVNRYSNMGKTNQLE